MGIAAANLCDREWDNLQYTENLPDWLKGRSVHRIYTHVHKTYIHVHNTKLTHMYTKLTHLYTKLTHNYTKLTHMYTKLTHMYTKLTHMYTKHVLGGSPTISWGVGSPYPHNSVIS
jgi:hypothetical protein